MIIIPFQLHDFFQMQSSENTPFKLDEITYEASTWNIAMKLQLVQSIWIKRKSNILQLPKGLVVRGIIDNIAMKLTGCKEMVDTEKNRANWRCFFFPDMLKKGESKKLENWGWLHHESCKWEPPPEGMVKEVALKVDKR